MPQTLPLPSWLAEWPAADPLLALWQGLPDGAGWGALALVAAGAVLGALAARLGRRQPSAAAVPAAAVPAAAQAPPPPEAPDRIAAFEAELAAARDAEIRLRADADAGVQAFCAVLAPALCTLSEAADQGRAAAAECAARADAVHACMVEASEDATRTAVTLTAVTAHVESLALSVEAVASTLQAVAEAIGADAGDRDADAALSAMAGVASDAEGASGPSLVGLAAESGRALAELVATLRATCAAADAVASRVSAVRDAAEGGSAAARAMARASETVGSSTVKIGLEFTAFLEGLSRAGDRRKSDRYPTDLAATVLVDGRAHPAHIIDISRGGCAMDGDPGLPTGTRVVLRLPGVARDLEATVARRLGSITGLMFAEADPLAGILETLISPPRQAA